MIETPPKALIQRLPEALISRIAAGEVVERPASIVKELLENSLDAGATRLDLTVGDGGRSIRLADNGSGMSAAELPLAFSNHATSKLSRFEDLETLSSFGFRGEALASVASVAKVHCQTRQAAAPEGAALSIEGGEMGSIKPVGCSPGTAIRIDDLFFNTTARLKFLKRPATELAVIEETVLAMALANPEVGVSLTTNGRTSYQLPEGQSLQQRINGCFKWNKAEDRQRAEASLLPVSLTDDEFGLSVEGYTASPAADWLHKRSRVKARWLFVNNRWIRCSTLGAAIDKAFESLVPHGQYPLAVLKLILPPRDVDVNVHPRKQEVRYAQPNTIFQFVFHALRQTLERSFLPPAQEATSSFSPPETLNEAIQTRSDATLDRRVGFNPFLSQPNSPLQTHEAEDYITPDNTAVTLEAQARFSEETVKSTAKQLAITSQGSSHPKTSSHQNWRVIGQLYQTYILLETVKGLMVVDQHIASERSCYEAFLKQDREQSPQTQRLLMPQSIALSPERKASLEAALPDVQALGFEVSLTEAGADLIGIPAVYLHRPQLSPTQQLLHVLESIEQSGQASADRELLMSTLACHTAIRAGDTLTHEQMNAIVEAWLACELPWTCPHGRPIAHTIEASELNNFFHRPSLPIGALPASL